jgi:hypothetical protein
VKSDNRVENLELLTAEANRQHARDRGLVKPMKGTANPMAKLTEDNVRAIRRLRAAGATARKIALLFDITERTVYQIEHRKAWRHIS